MSNRSLQLRVLIVIVEGGRGGSFFDIELLKSVGVVVVVRSFFFFFLVRMLKAVLGSELPTRPGKKKLEEFEKCQDYWFHPPRF